MPSKSIPEPWHSFLADIDAALTEDVELHSLGGFVATILYDLVRPTADVDLSRSIREVKSSLLCA
jgi:hypothetical protein